MMTTSVGGISTVQDVHAVDGSKGTILRSEARGNFFEIVQTSVSSSTCTARLDPLPQISTTMGAKRTIDSALSASNQSVAPHQIKIPRSTTSFISGGATGADLYWTKCVLHAGLDIELMSFVGHSIVAPAGAQIVRLSDTMLRNSDSALQRAARALKRTVPKPGYIKKLLQRNWYIVKDADAVLAIGKLLSKGEGLRVDGGTAWGCQMYYQHILSKKAAVNLWLFDLISQKWYKCSYGDWITSETPTVSGFTKVALIGSRDLGMEGIAAIESVPLTR